MVLKKVKVVGQYFGRRDADYFEISFLVDTKSGAIVHYHIKVD
jgi:hypothetical protein